MRNEMGESRDWFAVGGRVEELLYRNGWGIYYSVGSLDGKDLNTIDARNCLLCGTSVEVLPG